jgi:hypothetical protein
MNTAIPNGIVEIRQFVIKFTFPNNKYNDNMYMAAGIINNNADRRYLCVIAVVVFIEIKINPRMVIVGKATSKPAHLELNDLDNNVAPTTTAPDNINCKII